MADKIERGGAQPLSTNQEVAPVNNYSDNRETQQPVNNEYSQPEKNEYPQPVQNDFSQETRKGYSGSSDDVNRISSSNSGAPVVAEEKKPWWNIFLVPGSAPQIVTAAVFAIAIGLGVKSAVGTVPPAAITLVGIPGVLWLRALKAVGMFAIWAFVLSEQSWLTV